MAYHNVLFPKEISYGSKGGPAFKTTVITLASGLERRNQEWKRVRAIYDVSHGIKSPAELEELRSFFYARRGMANSFNYFDWGDHEIVTQNIGVGDGIKRNFQIIKSYIDDGNYQYDRVITKIEAGSDLPVTVNGTPRVKGTHYTLNESTGVVSFIGSAANIPAVGAVVAVPYAKFYVHARFDIDHFDPVHDFWLYQSWESIPIVEIKDAE